MYIIVKYSIVIYSSNILLLYSVVIYYSILHCSEMAATVSLFRLGDINSMGRGG